MLPPGMVGVVACIMAAVISRLLGDSVPSELREIILTLAVGTGTGAAASFAGRRWLARRQATGGPPPGRDPDWKRFIIIFVALFVLVDQVFDLYEQKLPRPMRLGVYLLGFIAAFLGIK